MMSSETYIVECANWKAKVDFTNTSSFESVGDKIFEVCTLAFENIFANTYNSDHVMVFELKNSNGIDYFKDLKMEKIPDPSFSLLTKAYSLKDEDNESKHYFVLTRSLLENASLPDMLLELKDFEKIMKNNNKFFYKNLISLFKNCNILTNLK